MPGPLDDPTDIRRYSNALRLDTERAMVKLADQLIDGEIELADWHTEMKTQLRRANYIQFVVGKGGRREQIQAREYLQLGPELKRQYAFLRRFAGEIAKRSEAGKALDFVRFRAQLYARSTQAMMWKSAVPVKLPQVPRDGKTACRTNCKCRLEYDYERDENGVIVAVLVYWKLRPAEHCDDCIKLSREWNPRRFEITQETAPLDQAVDLLLMEAHDLDGPSQAIIRAMWEVDYALPA